MRFDLPYDRKSVSVEIDDRNFVGSLVSKVPLEYARTADEAMRRAHEIEG
jgi:hypothetical protein